MQSMIIPYSALPWIWLGLTIVLVIIECITSGLTTIWFAFGSFVMIFASLLRFPIWLQVLLFSAISLVLLIFTRPIIKKKIFTKKQAMNSDAIIGSKAIVVQDISDTKKGAIKINGLEWTASTLAGETLKVGDKCIIVEIKGVTAYVKSLPE